jgi:hypothetical protein
MKHFLLFRKFGFLQAVLMGYFAFSGIFSLASCEEAMRASAELCNAPQKGNSDYPTADELGLNISLNCILGMTGAYSKSEKNSPSGNKEVPYSTQYSPYSSYQDYQDAIESKDTKVGGLAIWTGLEFVQKGFKSTLGNNSISKSRLDYLEVPVYGMYRYRLSDGGVLYGGLGPYFAYGIAGNTKDGSYSSSSFGENNEGYKRFDAGLGIIGGYRFNFGLSVDLSYELGLVDIAYASEDITARNRAFSINVGYPLSKLIPGLK